MARKRGSRLGRTDGRGLVILLALILVWVWGGAAVAEDAPPVLTLRECVDTALEKSPAMMSADQTLVGAEWQRKKAYTGFLPTFKVDYSYVRLDEAPTSTVMGVTSDRGTRDNYSLDASITQPLFTGFALTSQYELSKLGLNVAEIAKVQTRMDVILQAKEGYFGLLQAEKALEVAQQSVKQLTAHLDVARSFYQVGMVPKNHVLQAEVRLAQAVQNEIIVEHQRRYALAALNTLLRRDMDAPVRLEDILSYKPFGKGLDEAIKTGLGSRPEVQLARRQIEVNEQKVTAAKSGYYPSVSLRYTYTKEGDKWNVDGSPYHDANAWNIAAVASWNFWEWGRTRDEVQVNRTEVSKAGHALTQVQDAVQLEVKRSYLAMEAAEKNIQVATKALEQAEENYRMNEERYREQVATFTEVMDAETLLTSARTNYVSALYQFNLAVATLERAMGLDQY